MSISVGKAKKPETEPVQGEEQKPAARKGRPPKAAEGSAKKAAKKGGEKKAAALANEKEILSRGPFTFKEHRKVQQFTCICGHKGSKAIVLLDRNGNEVLTGATCLPKFGLKVPGVVSGKNGVVTL